MVNNHWGYHSQNRSYERKKAYYDIYKTNRPTTSKEILNAYHLGYLGMEKNFPIQTSSIRKRKKKSIGFSQEEINFNQEHTKKRIIIKHTICRLKKYRILEDMFRNKIRQYNKVSDIVSGLINYRIMKYRNKPNTKSMEWCR